MGYPTLKGGNSMRDIAVASNYKCPYCGSIRAGFLRCNCGNCGGPYIKEEKKNENS
jgi:hypothetical protein